MRHYLIVGNQTLGGCELAAEIACRLERGPSRFFVLVPATRPHDFYGTIMNALEGEPITERDAEEIAEHRLAGSIEWIRDHGGIAEGVVGDPHPLTAIADVLNSQHFDEIIVSTLPSHVSKWLRLDLPTRVAHSFDIPVTNVVAAPVE